MPKKAGIDASCATVTCAVTIGRDPRDRGYMLSAKLTVSLAHENREKSEELIAQAHKLCPYSKAIHGNVDVEVVLA